MIRRPSIVVGLTAALALACPVHLGANPVVVPQGIFQAPGQASAGRAKLMDGAAALDRADLAAAETAFKSALELDRKLVLAYVGLAEVAGQRKDRTAVEGWLKKALAVAPTDTRVLRVWGRHQFQAGRFAEADVTFKRADALEPGSAATQVLMGENYLLGLKKPKLAEQAHRNAIAAEAGNVLAHLGLGASLAAQGRAAQAQAAFEKAAELAPADPRPTHALARLLASQTKFDQAIAALDRTIAIAPDFLPAYLDRGDLFLAKDEPERAAQTFRAAAQAVKAPAMAYFRLGVTLEALQRWDEAERAYLDALKGAPKMAAAYNNLAYMNASRGVRLDEALAWARKAIELAPKNPTLLDTLGWVQRARGELEPAAASIRKALADSPQQPNFHYHLGVVYADQGKTREAIASLQRALELNKNFRNAGDAQARLSQLRGK